MALHQSPWLYSLSTVTPHESGNDSTLASFTTNPDFNNMAVSQYQKNELSNSNAQMPLLSSESSFSQQLLKNAKNSYTPKAQSRFRAQKLRNTRQLNSVEEADTGIVSPGIKFLRMQFYRTKLCPSLVTSGTCHNINSCHYAHSSKDLRPLPNLSKTKVCPEMVKTGYCSKQHQCNYAHSNMELRATEFVNKTHMCYAWKRSACPAGDACRFAHGEQELRLLTNNCSCITTKINNREQTGNNTATYYIPQKSNVIITSIHPENTSIQQDHDARKQEQMMQNSILPPNQNLWQYNQEKNLTKYPYGRRSSTNGTVQRRLLPSHQHHHIHANNFIYNNQFDEAAVPTTFVGQGPSYFECNNSSRAFHDQQQSYHHQQSLKSLKDTRSSVQSRNALHKTSTFVSPLNGLESMNSKQTVSSTHMFSNADNSRRFSYNYKKSNLENHLNCQDNFLPYNIPGNMIENNRFKKNVLKPSTGFNGTNMYQPVVYTVPCNYTENTDKTKSSTVPQETPKKNSQKNDNLKYLHSDLPSEPTISSQAPIELSAPASNPLLYTNTNQFYINSPREFSKLSSDFLWFTSAIDARHINLSTTAPLQTPTTSPVISPASLNSTPRMWPSSAHRIAVHLHSNPVFTDKVISPR